MRQCLAEFIGTFILCFAGIAAIVSTQEPISSGAGLVGVALAHGLAVSIAVSVFGGVSGAHINPAVTCSLLATGRIQLPMAGAYIVSQCLASALAAFLCTIIFTNEAVNEVKLGIPLPPQVENVVAGEEAPVPTHVVLLVEFILTFLLVIAVFGTAVDERGKAVKIGGFAIGLTVTMDILAGGAVTGASMNPARSFGPALVHGYWGLHWCYWVAPILGGVAAALIYQNLILSDEE